VLRGERAEGRFGAASAKLHVVWLLCVGVCFQSILQDLNKNYDIIKQVTHSLMKFHQITCSLPLSVGDTNVLSASVDSRYTHQDVGFWFSVPVKSVIILFRYFYLNLLNSISVVCGFWGLE